MDQIGESVNWVGMFIIFIVPTMCLFLLITQGYSDTVLDRVKAAAWYVLITVSITSIVVWFLS